MGSTMYTKSDLFVDDSTGYSEKNVSISANIKNLTGSQKSVYPIELLRFSCILFLENCRQVEINPSIDNRRFVGHVFKSIETQSPTACQVNCFVEGDCVSFNVKPLQSENHLCELSNSSDVVHPEDLKDEQGFVYTSFKVRDLKQSIEKPCIF